MSKQIDEEERRKLLLELTEVQDVLASWHFLPEVNEDELVAVICKIEAIRRGLRSNG